MKIKLHPRPGTKIDNHIERTAEGLNQGCNVILWLSAAVLLFVYNAPVKQRHNEQHASRQLSERDYLFAVADSRHGSKPSESDLQAIEQQFAMETRQEDIDRMKPKARARYYASLGRAE